MATETGRRPAPGERGEVVLFLDGARGYRRQVYRYAASKLVVVHECERTGAAWTETWFDTSEDDEHQELQDAVQAMNEGDQ